MVIQVNRRQFERITARNTQRIVRIGNQCLQAIGPDFHKLQLSLPGPGVSGKRKHQSLQRGGRFGLVKSDNQRRRDADHQCSPGNALHGLCLHDIFEIHQPGLLERLLDDSTLQGRSSQPGILLVLQELNRTDQAVAKLGKAPLNPQRQVDVGHGNLKGRDQPLIGDITRTAENAQPQDQPHARIVQVEQPIYAAHNQQGTQQDGHQPAESIQPQQLANLCPQFCQTFLQG